MSTSQDWSTGYPEAGPEPDPQYNPPRPAQSNLTTEQWVHITLANTHVPAKDDAPYAVEWTGFGAVVWHRTPELVAGVSRSFTKHRFWPGKVVIADPSSADGLEAARISVEPEPQKWLDRTVETMSKDARIRAGIFMVLGVISAFSEPWVGIPSFVAGAAFFGWKFLQGRRKRQRRARLVADSNLFVLDGRSLDLSLLPRTDEKDFTRVSPEDSKWVNPKKIIEKRPSWFGLSQQVAAMCAKDDEVARVAGSALRNILWMGREDLNHPDVVRALWTLKGSTVSMLASRERLEKALVASFAEDSTSEREARLDVLRGEAQRMIEEVRTQATVYGSVADDITARAR